MNDEMVNDGKDKLDLAYRELIKQKVTISVYFNQYQDLRSKLEAPPKIEDSLNSKQSRPKSSK